MIPNDTPWSGLEAGKVDTRRVSASARWNWFWAVMPRADVALVLQLSDLPKPAPELPKLRNLEIRFQTLPGGPILYIRLKDNAQLELFETLCRDVMAAGDRSGQAREDMVIDFAGDFGAPLPALKASQTGAALESYLLIVPGTQIAAIYDKWGPRLLEANVRSFLQARAKTNKGIQKTMKEEPDLFFPYNNGLSATADHVSCVRTDDGLAIASISNLQIVNGAQTTGSIHAGLKSARDQLSQIFVQMKLTVVPDDRSEDIVPKISEYANTQNKVNAADFFSNHPFHIRIEQFSRAVIFNAREGERHDSKWFYERSRGQFINARARLSVAQQKKFDLEFPKTQL